MAIALNYLAVRYPAIYHTAAEMYARNASLSALETRPSALSSTRKIIVAGGLDAGNVRQAIAQAQPWGVDACSRIEKSPDRKDHARMKEFIKAAKEASA